MPDIDSASQRTRDDYAGDIYLSRCIFDGQVHVHECHQLVVPLNAPMEFETGGVSGRAVILPRINAGQKWNFLVP